MKKILAYIVTLACLFSCVVPVTVQATTYPELLTNGSFTSNTAGWSGSTISSLTSGYSGKGLQLQKKVGGGWCDIKTTAKLSLHFFKTYQLTYYAKAITSESIGKTTYAYLDFRDATDAIFPDYQNINPTGNRQLTADWVKYEATFSLPFTTSEAATSYLYLRLGDGSRTAAETFAVDEVSIKQVEPYSPELSFLVQRPLSSNSTYTLKPQYTTSIGGYKYTLLDANDGVVQAEQQVTGLQSFTLPASYFTNGTKIRYQGWDAFNNTTTQTTKVLADLIETAKEAPSPSMSLRDDNSFWDEDGDTLTAVFTYENAEKTRDNVHLFAAQYAADGSLIATDWSTGTVNITKGESDVINKTVTAAEGAVRAKFFAWEDGTNAPLVDEIVEINKTVSGQFIYADANAQNNGDGTRANPFNNLASVQTKLDTVIANADSTPVYVVLAPGEYHATEALHLNRAEYGVEKAVTFTTSAPGKATISGGTHILGSNFASYGSGIYRAQVPQGTQSRQLYVNGIKATRARTEEDPEGFVNLDYAPYESGNVAYFYNEGLTWEDSRYASLAGNDEVELVFVENWRHMYIKPDNVAWNASEGKLAFTFAKDRDGKTDMGNAGAWMAMTRCNTEATKPAYLENALEFLDEEGEWYLDSDNGYLYYKPRSFETLATADVVLPETEALFSLQGTAANPVANVSLHNLEFAYSTWNYPTEHRSFYVHQNTSYGGSVLEQSTLYGGKEKPSKNGEEVVYYTYIGTNSNRDKDANGHLQHDGGQLIDAAVEMKNVKNINIDNCDFNHLGAIALKMTGAVQDCNVTGNEFYDISASGIALGDVRNLYDFGIAANASSFGGWWDLEHPSSQQAITNNTISDNYIHKIATDYHSSAALSTGYVKNTTIKNNELADGAYSGMHLGWGWQSNTTDVVIENVKVEQNYIHDFMNARVFDGAGIYTLGGTKTSGVRSAIRGNYFTNINNLYGGIYPDEGSTNWDISENVVDLTTGSMGYKSYRTEETPEANYWLHLWSISSKNNKVFDNYSTTSSSKHSVDNEFEEPEIAPGGVWSSSAVSVISASGVSAKYKSRFNFMNESMQLPQVMEVGVGATQDIMTGCRVIPKERPFDLSSCDVTVSSSNNSIASVSGTRITGVKAGAAWITVSVRKASANYYDTFTFCVYVK